MCSVLIVHTSEAQDWASYLKIILEASHHFPQNSISFYLLDGEHSMQDEDYSIFSTSQCILLLISVAFIDIQSEPGVRNGLKKFLYPHSKIVAFLCGVSESDGLMDCFEDWNSWRKLDSDDEPALYIATVCEVVKEENVTNLEDKEMRENKITSPRQSMDQPALDEPQLHSDQFHSPEEAGDVSDRNLTQSRSLSASEEQKACLTVQPNRILSGTPVDIYFIMVNKLDSQDNIEVEFCCEHSTKLVSGTAVNEYIVTVQSPDMPTGEVTLHLYSNESIVCSTTVTYYTEMEEISNYLEKVTDPVNFMCQAFSITSNASEELDNLFTDSLKNHMPPNGLKVFGVNQLQEDITNQRDVELPTLLHFSAKYGLKKLTSTLLQCPGALQAYSTANKNGDYPNTLAERSGFPDLRQFMDDYVETIDLVKSHIEESITTPEDEDIYEPMANSSQNFVAKFSLQEDIYESMMQLNPDMQLYEDLDSLDSSFNESQPEDAVLRKFFEVNAKKHSETEDDLGNDTYSGRRVDETEEENLEDNVENYEEEDDEDPYKCCYPDDIYDTIDDEESFASVIVNRPPAPIPRTCTTSEPEECKTYISTVFSSKNPLYSENSCKKDQTPQVRPVPERMLSSGHDPYAGMKTPGQRQLISLQERVKVGALTVEEAVQEFKAWQFDQEKRSQSIRFQQENLQKLRDSISRRKKGKGGKVLDLDITAPVQRNLRWGSHMNVECSVYVPASGSLTQPPSVNRPPQRGTWQTGSTSSTSSSGSNRLSTLSTISNSSGAEELEEPQENVLPPPRPPRPATETPPTLPPPRIPPRLPERYPESMLNERYVSSPARHLSHAPPHRPIPPPPTTRRPR